MRRGCALSRTVRRCSASTTTATRVFDTARSAFRGLAVVRSRMALRRSFAWIMETVSIRQSDLEEAASRAIQEYQRWRTKGGEVEDTHRSGMWHERNRVGAPSGGIRRRGILRAGMSHGLPHRPGQLRRRHGWHGRECGPRKPGTPPWLRALLRYGRAPSWVLLRCESWRPIMTSSTRRHWLRSEASS